MGTVDSSLPPLGRSLSPCGLTDEPVAEIVQCGEPLSRCEFGTPAGLQATERLSPRLGSNPLQGVASRCAPRGESSAFTLTIVESPSSTPASNPELKFKKF